jgi:Protein of unknown function (DUF2992)
MTGQPEFVAIHLTLLYESAFWVAVFEREQHSTLSVARVVFGAEPTAPALLEWLQINYHHLEFSSVTVEAKTSTERVNPKRAIREAKRAAFTRGVSRAAQEAMCLTLESRKKIRLEISKADKEAEEEQCYELRRARAKARHRGRA